MNMPQNNNQQASSSSQNRNNSSSSTSNHLQNVQQQQAAALAAAAAQATNKNSNSQAATNHVLNQLHSTKNNISELIQRLSSEHDNQNSQIGNFKLEFDKLSHHNKELEQQQHSYYDIMIRLKTDVLHNHSIVQRMQAIIINMVGNLPPDQQQQIASMMDKAKILDVNDQGKLVQQAAQQLQVDLAQNNILKNGNSNPGGAVAQALANLQKIPVSSAGNMLDPTHALMQQQQQQQNQPNLLNMLSNNMLQNPAQQNNMLPGLIQLLSNQNNSGGMNPLLAGMNPANLQNNNTLAAAAAALQANNSNNNLLAGNSSNNLLNLQQQNLIKIQHSLAQQQQKTENKNGQNQHSLLNQQSLQNGAQSALNALLPNSQHSANHQNLLNPGHNQNNPTQANSLNPNLPNFSNLQNMASRGDSRSSVRSNELSPPIKNHNGPPKPKKIKSEIPTTVTNEDDNSEQELVVDETENGGSLNPAAMNLIQLQQATQNALKQGNPGLGPLLNQNGMKIESQSDILSSINQASIPSTVPNSLTNTISNPSNQIPLLNPSLNAAQLALNPTAALLQQQLSNASGLAPDFSQLLQNTVSDHNNGFALRMGKNNCLLERTDFNNANKQLLYSNPANMTLPKSCSVVKTFNHQEVVCAVTLSSKTQHVFTGGKGIVKIWDASEELGNTEISENEDNLSNSRASSRADNNNPTSLQLPNSSNISRPGSRCSVKTANQELYQIEGLDAGNYIRSCKIYDSGSKMIVGGEATVLTVWDLPTSTSGTPQKIAELTSEAPACYALCIPEEGPSSTCYSCCSDGFVSVWDLRTHSIVKKFRAHNDGASCVDYKNGQLWTGGLDNSVKSWDIRNIGDSTVQNHLNMYELPAQVFSLSCNPYENWVACGLEDSTVEVLNTGPVTESTKRLEMWTHKIAENTEKRQNAPQMSKMSFSKLFRLFQILCLPLTTQTNTNYTATTVVSYL